MAANPDDTEQICYNLKVLTAVIKQDVSENTAEAGVEGNPERPGRVLQGKPQWEIFLGHFMCK